MWKKELKPGHKGPLAPSETGTVINHPHVVQKGDDAWGRGVVDFRLLNSMTKKQGRGLWRCGMR